MTKNNHAVQARWWTVALSEEVIADKPFAVICEDKDYVLFRDNAGSVRALVDQCAHRRAPLSLGHISVDGHIECPYHGWRYDGGNGACVAIPNLSVTERVPATYRVPAFAVVEQDGFIQLWTQGMDADERVIHPLALAAQALASQGTALIAYPYAELVDLLLDAPGVVLDIAGVTVVDRHRYGKPIIESAANDNMQRVVVNHAAMWSSQRKRSPQNVIADYPLAVRVAVAANGHTARVEVHTDADELLASAIIAMTPVKSTLTSVRWRSAGVQRGKRAMQIRVRAQLQAEAIKSVYAYPSVIRRELAQSQQVAAN
jgi:phenylpropionate dioxygenase-like ring-hydroxylating dioxygenase large terminal subunit